MYKNSVVFLIIVTNSGCLFFSMTTAHIAPQGQNSFGFGYQLPTEYADHGVYYGWSRTPMSSRFEIGFTLAGITDQPTSIEQSTHLPTGEETVACMRIDGKYLLAASFDERFSLSTGGALHVYYPFWPGIGARLMASYRLPVLTPYSGVEVGASFIYPYCYCWVGCEIRPVDLMSLYVEIAPTSWFLRESWQSVQFGAQFSF